MRSGLLAIGALSYALAVGQVWAADCTDLSKKEPVSLSGLLEHRTFSAATDENVTKSDFPESAYLLKLDPPRCFIGHEILDGEVEVKLVQLIVSADDERGLFGQLKKLTGSNVTVTGKDAFGANGSQKHALVSVVVSSVSSNRTGELRIGEAEPDVMEPGDGAEAKTLDIEPGDKTTATERRDTGIETVEGFYLALAAGDGAGAAQHIIPAKRKSGPLSARAMTSFYGALKRPLRLLDVRHLGRGRYRASYTFETTQGMRCHGKSVVTTVPFGSANLISRIVAENGC